MVSFIPLAGRPPRSDRARAGRRDLREHAPLHARRVAGRRGVAHRASGGHDPRLGRRLASRGPGGARPPVRGHRVRRTISSPTSRRRSTQRLTGRLAAAAGRTIGPSPSPGPRCTIAPDCGSRLPLERPGPWPRSRAMRGRSTIEPTRAGRAGPYARSGTKTMSATSPRTPSAVGARPRRPIVSRPPASGGTDPARTCRPPSSTRTRSGPGRAWSPPRARSSSGPASTPAARPRTSSSSASRRATTRSGGARSTGPISEEHYDRLRARLMAYLADARHVRPGPVHRRRTRRTAARSASTPRPPGRASSPATSSAGRRPRTWPRFAPNFTIIDVPSFKADPDDRGHPHGDGDPASTSSRMEVIIVGTEYAGEIKKSRVHGHELPAARRGRPADALGDQRRARRATRSIFFGLSGTGKTTLSADPARSLIGDDEHGWGDDGVFNFEGGCYAKTIRLSPMYEPDIFADDPPLRRRSSRTSTSTR